MNHRFYQLFTNSRASGGVRRGRHLIWQCFISFIISALYLSSAGHAATEPSLPAPSPLAGIQVAGGTQGVATVDDMGNAQAAVSIDVLPGINGLQPGLNLVYNSGLSNSNSQMGVGWRIAGANTSIDRCGKTRAHGDGRLQGAIFENDDALCMEGARLVRTAGTDITNATFEREIHVAGGKVIIQSSGSGSNITMEMRPEDGSVMRFNERVVLNGEVGTWLLSEVVDKHGNRMEYRYSYEREESPQLVEINYAHDGTRYRHQVRFVFIENRDDIEQAYRNGVLIDKDELLTRIEIVKDAAVKYRYELTYNEDSNGNPAFSPSERARLSSVQEFDAQGNFKEPIRFTYNDDDAPSDEDRTALVAEFEFVQQLGHSPGVFIEDVDNDGKLDLVATRIRTNDSGSNASCTVHNQIWTRLASENYETAHSSGGLPDNSAGYFGYTKPAFNECKYNEKVFDPLRPNPIYMGAHLIDINDDGLPDQVNIGFVDNEPETVQTTTHLNLGNGKFSNGSAANGRLIRTRLGGNRVGVDNDADDEDVSPYVNSEAAEFMVADFNGDGCEDIYKIHTRVDDDNDDAVRISKWMNQCKNDQATELFVEQVPGDEESGSEVLLQEWEAPDSTTRQYFIPMDLNGDLLPDILVIGSDSGFVNIKHFINDGTGNFGGDAFDARPAADYIFGPQDSSTSIDLRWNSRGGGSESQYLPADVNGDGFLDLLVLRISGSWVFQYSYINTGKGDGSGQFFRLNDEHVTVQNDAVPTDGPLTPKFFALDWNGDNAVDLVKIEPNPSDDDVARLVLYRNDGKGIVGIEDPTGGVPTDHGEVINDNIGPWYSEKLSHISRRNHYQPADPNGDGLLGFVALNWATFTVDQEGGAGGNPSDDVNISFYDAETPYRSDLLTRIDNFDSGLVQELDYVSLAQAGDEDGSRVIYNNDGETITDPITAQELEPYDRGLWVVSDQTTRSQTENPHYDYGSTTTEYTYHNFKADEEGRGFAGFDKVEKYFVEKHKVSSAEFHQFFPFAMMIRSTEDRDIANTVVHTTQALYAEKAPIEGVEPNHFIHRVYAAEGAEFFSGADGNGHRSLNSITKDRYDEELRIKLTTAITNVNYDGFMDGEETVVCTSYTYGGYSPDNPTIPILGNADTITTIPSNFVPGDFDEDCSSISSVTADMQRQIQMSYENLNIKQSTVGNVDGSIAISTKYDYDRFGNGISTIEPLGNTTKSDYITGADVPGLFVMRNETPPTKNSGPLVASYQYNDFGQNILTTGPTGTCARTEYDGFGRVIAVYGEDSDPNSNPCSLLVKRIAYENNPGGEGGMKVVTRDRLDFDLPESEFFETISYSDPYQRGMMSTRTIRGAELTTQERNLSSADEEGVIKEATAQLNGTTFGETRTIYDVAGRTAEVQMRLPGGSTTPEKVQTYEYFTAQNAIKVFSFDPSTSGTFDSVNPRQTVLGSQHGADLPRQKIFRNTASHIFTYTDYGEPETFTDAKDETVTLTYDVLGRMVSRYSTNNDSSRIYTYDDNNNFKTQLEPRQKYLTTYTYDALDRITEETVTDLELADVSQLGIGEPGVVSRVTNTYDCVIPGVRYCEGEQSRLEVQTLEVVNGEEGPASIENHIVTDFIYNKFGELDTQRYTIRVEDDIPVETTYTTSYTYFFGGGIKTETYPNGYRRRVIRDTDGLVTSVLVENKNDEATETTIAQSDYPEYDLRTGRYTRRSDRNDLAYTRTFDHLGLPETVQVGLVGPNTWVAGEQVHRNKIGLTKIIDRLGSIDDNPLGARLFNETYDYDSMGFLISAVSNNEYSSFSGSGFQYSYDLEGNREIKTIDGVELEYRYDSDKAHQLTSFERLVNGEKKVIEQEYDAAGNMVRKGNLLMAYDDNNQISRITKATGENSAEFMMSAFYVGGNRVMKKESIVDPYGASASVLLQEDFDDGDHNGWSVVDEGEDNAPSEWEVLDGELVESSNIHGDSSRTKNAKLGTYALYDGGASWTDYQVDLTIRSGDNDGIGLMFRMQDGNNYYRYSMDESRGYARLEKNVNGVMLGLWDAGSSYTYTEDQDHELSIRVAGPTIEVYFDGVLVETVEDDTFSSGTIALYSYQNDEAVFDDITVSGEYNPGAGPSPDPSPEPSPVLGETLAEENFDQYPYPTKMFPSNWKAYDGSSVRRKSDWYQYNADSRTDTGRLMQDNSVYVKGTNNAKLLPKLGTYLQYVPGLHWTDYQFDVKLSTIQPNDIGVMFRVQDKENYYRFSINNNGDYARLVKNVNGEFTLLGESDVRYKPRAFKSGAISISVHHDIRIRVLGTSIEVYFDGVRVIAVTDDSLSSGTIALYNRATSTSLYDDVRVVALEQAPAVPEEPEVPPDRGITLLSAGTLAADTTITRYIGSYQVVVKGAGSDDAGEQLHTIHMAGVEGVPAVITVDGRDVTLLAQQIEHQSLLQWATVYDTGSLSGLMGAGLAYMEAYLAHPRMQPAHPDFDKTVQWSMIAGLPLIFFGFLFCQGRHRRRGGVSVLVVDSSQDEGDETEFKQQHQYLYWMAWVMITVFYFYSVSPANAAVVPGLSDPSDPSPIVAGPNGAGYEVYEGPRPVATVHYQYNNANGGTMATADNNGNRINYLLYEPFGAVDIGASRGADITRAKFTGKEADSSTGLMYFGARYYDSETGRFTSEDAASQFASPYRYGLQPLDSTDPDGNWVIVPIIVGMLLVGISVAIEVDIATNPSKYSDSEKLGLTMFAFVIQAVGLAMFTGGMSLGISIVRASGWSALRSFMKAELAKARDFFLRGAQILPGTAGRGGAWASSRWADPDTPYNLATAAGSYKQVFDAAVRNNTGLASIASKGLGPWALPVKSSRELRQTRILGGVETAFENFGLLYWGQTAYGDSLDPADWHYNAVAWAPWASWLTGQWGRVVGQLNRFNPAKWKSKKYLPVAGNKFQAFWGSGAYSFGYAQIYMSGVELHSDESFTHGERAVNGLKSFIIGGLWGIPSKGLVMLRGRIKKTDIGTSPFGQSRGVAIAALPLQTTWDFIGKTVVLEWVLAGRDPFTNKIVWDSWLQIPSYVEKN